MVGAAPPAKDEQFNLRDMDDLILEAAALFQSGDLSWLKHDGINRDPF